MVDIRQIDDRDAWNRLAQSFPTCDLRQSHEWGEIRRSHGWTPLRLAAFRDGECIAAVSALWRRVPVLGTVAYAPRGPVMDVDDERAWEALPALLGAVRDRVRAAWLRMSLGVADDRWEVRGRLREGGLVALPDFWSYWNSPRNVMRLPLDGTERDMLARMARKRRQHISTAAKRGIETTLETAPANLEAFHRLLVEHAERHRYPVRDRAYFEALRVAFAASGGLALVTGRVEGRVATALLGVRFGALAYPLYAPSSPEARGLPVGDAVHWEWLRWAKAAGCREADFGSSGTHVPPRETDGNLGIYRFKVEIGCALNLWLPYHDAVFDPVRHRLARGLERRALGHVRAWLGRMPAGMRAVLTRRAA